MKMFAYKKSFLVIIAALIAIEILVIYLWALASMPWPILLILLLIFNYRILRFATEYTKKITLEDDYIYISMVGGRFERRYRYEDIIEMITTNVWPKYVGFKTNNYNDWPLLFSTGFGLGFNLLFMERGQELSREIRERSSLTKSGFLRWYK